MIETRETQKAGKPLTGEDWVLAARDLLIEEGIQGLTLRRLAAKLEVTTGAFYWLYKNFDQLLEALLSHWETVNSAAFNETFERPCGDWRWQYFRYLRILFDRSLYDPGYDVAVRDWARSSAAALCVVRKVDAGRISQLQTLFEGQGFHPPAALVRAQLLYFHQVGYDEIGMSESLSERIARVPYYADILCPGTMPLDISLDDLHQLIFSSDDQVPHPGVTG